MPETADAIVTADATLVGMYGRIGVLLAVILVVPIWMVDYPPLVDYPNHLARGYILYHYDDVPGFAQRFEIDHRPMPNLAIDYFLLALQPICTVYMAGKLFLTITLWLWLLGWHCLGSAIHGKSTWLALASALVAYHSMFLYGFANYSFGLGMFLISTAAWLCWRARWAWWRLLVMALLAFGCYFSHLSAFVFLAGTALAVTFWEALQQRKVTGSMLLGLMPVLLPFVLFSRGGSGEAGIVWNTLTGKLIGLLCLFRGYDRTLDAIFMAAVALGVILLAVWSTGQRCRGRTLFAGLGCVAMFLIAPYEIFNGMPADARFLAPAASLIVLSFDVTLPRKKALILLGFFGGLVLFRMTTIGVVWRSLDADLREQAALFEVFPEEACVYPIVQVPEPAAEQKLNAVSFHIIEYAVIDRHIDSPHLLAFRGQQPIRYRVPPIIYHSAADRFPDLAKVDWDRVLGHYDYVWCRRVPDDYRDLLTTRCTLVAESGATTVWRVRKTP